MTSLPCEEIGELLGEVGSPGSFTARRTATAEDLDLEVKGLGRLPFPISRAQAQNLCHLARPARYGRGEQTLLDRRVRDTWEIPKSRVKIDRRRWNRTLLPVLDALRADLGLRDGCRLKAELHSMLVYAPGQFFLPHRDSEKADEMVGTLVVTLPTRCKGGTMVVEHHGEKVTHRAAEKHLSFVAFYADCTHEVRPVREGYRVVLTYDLMLQGEAAAASAMAAETAPATVEALTELLREHFETPLASRWPREEDTPPREPPSRLVYLLDHQYTERGLGWGRLKGDDAARAAVLQAAAERTGCEVALALAEVHETWGCLEPGWDEPWYGRHRRWARDDDDWYADDEPPADDPDQYELVDLHDWSITLDRWIAPSSETAEPILTAVHSDEVAATTPSSLLEPTACEYEGYMGNYGNTMDRWYRRGALVLWPRERAFAVRAEASPSWALEAMSQRIQAGEVAEAREMAASLVSFWGTVAQGNAGRGFFASALRVAVGLDQPTLAASLLRPFRVEAVTPGRAAELVALVERYGEGWARTLLSEWSRPTEPWLLFEKQDPIAWLADSLPRLCEALRASGDAVRTLATRLLLQDRWAWLQQAIEERRDGLLPPSRRDERLATLAGPIRGFLESAAIVEADDLRDDAITFVCSNENEPLLFCLVQVLRAAAETIAPAKLTALGFDTLRRHCAKLLEKRLARPARAEGDWSIARPPGCGCDLCSTLDAFLAAPGERQLEWRLAKEGRKHVHRQLDLYELPVHHSTRRLGRPYTLVLTKADTLFKREARDRRAWQADLDWLAGQGSGDQDSASPP